MNLLWQEPCSLTSAHEILTLGHACALTGPHGIPCRVLDVSSTQHIGMFPLLSCTRFYYVEMSTTGDWYVRSYRYLLPIDSVYRIHQRVVGCVAILTAYVPFWFVCLGIGHALPYGALMRPLFHMVSFLIPLNFWRFCARVHFLWFTVPLLWTSTTLVWSCTGTLQHWLYYLYISLVLVRVRDTLCDIHMEYLKISF